MEDKSGTIGVGNRYGNIRVDAIDEKVSTGRNRFVFFFVKRLFDIVSSLAAMIILSPVFLIIAIAVYIDNPGPVFFGHKRLGQHGRPIKVWKFRSMCMNAEEMIRSLPPEQKAEYYKNFKLDNDPRITRVGAFLRKTSLDELPQFFNVFIGDMSIVGPRPIVLRELEMYGDNKDKFLSMKPGITGNWQASGRSALTYENGRCEVELYYADHMSIWFDIKLLFKTVYVVLLQRGAK